LPDLPELKSPTNANGSAANTATPEPSFEEVKKPAETKTETKKSVPEPVKAEAATPKPKEEVKKETPKPA